MRSPRGRCLAALLGVTALARVEAAAFAAHEKLFALTLAIDGAQSGYLVSVSGGSRSAPVVAGAAGAGGRTKRQLGAVRYDDLEIRATLPLPAPLGAWVRDFLAGGSQVHGGVVTVLDMDRKSVGTVAFEGARLVRLSVPDLDAAASKRALQVALVLRPGSVLRGPGSGQVMAAPAPGAQPVVHSSSFEAVVGGLEANAVVALEGLGASAAEAGGPELPAFRVLLRTPLPPAWTAWAEGFLVAGKTSDADEKEIELRFITPGGAPTGIAIRLSQVGVSGMPAAALVVGEAAAQRWPLEVYAEKLELVEPAPPPAKGGPVAAGPTAPAGLVAYPASVAAVPGATATASATAGSPAGTGPGPVAEAGAGAGGPADDEGARDLTDFPRPAASVRKSYTYVSDKRYVDERAEYRVREAPAQVEKEFGAAVREAGYEPEGRSESGEPRKGTYALELRYRRAARTARITIRPGKEATSVAVILYELFPAPK